MKEILIIAEDRIINRVNHALKGTEARFSVCNDISKAYKTVMDKEYDLIIVDVEVGRIKSFELPGIKLIEDMRKLDYYKFTPVIAICDCERHEKLLFEQLHCYASFQRMFDISAFVKCVSETFCFNKRKDEISYRAYKSDGVIQLIHLQDVVYIESVDHNVYIYNNNNEVVKLSYISLEKILEDFNDKYFIQCKRNLLVNLRYVKHADLQNRYLYLNALNKNIEIGRSYIAEVRNIIKAKK